MDLGTPVFFGILVIPLLAVSAAIVRGPLGWSGAALGAGIDAWIFRKDLRETFRLVRGSRNWLKGAEGERRVGAELAKLPDEYVVFHDYHPRGADGQRAEWNIDHVVLGPTGVFVIETKNYGQRAVRSAKDDARTRKNVDQVSRSARELKDKLKVWSLGGLSSVFTEALLVYAQDGAWVDNTREGYTHVVPLKLLRKEILGRPKKDISPEQAYAVARVLWSQMTTHDQLDCRAEWDLVLADSKAVREARVRRQLEKRNANESAAESAVPGKCPHCGALLVRRIARFGPRAGKPFLGCSQYGRTCQKPFGIGLDEEQSTSA